MTKNEIIGRLAKERIVETIVSNIAKSADCDDTLKDLSQEIYLDLLSKDEEKIINLYETNQIRLFVVRMVTNNLFTKNRPFYQTFKKNTNATINIDDLKDKL